MCWTCTRYNQWKQIENSGNCPSNSACCFTCSHIYLFGDFLQEKIKVETGNSVLDAFTLDNVDLTRMKKYDAFVCYQFDSDDDFVKNTIIPELEQKPDSPFKLCVSMRMILNQVMAY